MPPHWAVFGHVLSGLSCAFAMSCLWLMCLLAILLFADVGADAVYWEDLFTDPSSRGVPDFRDSWHGVDFASVRSILEPSLRGPTGIPDRRVLILGSGDSRFPEDLYDSGVQGVTVLDRSQAAISAMAAQNVGVRDGITWVAGNAEIPDLKTDAFDVVVDIGLLDSVISEAGSAEQVLLEVKRMLSQGGMFLSASTEPPKWRLPLFNGGWSTEVTHLPRTRKLDPRVAAMNPEFNVDTIALYVARRMKEAENTEAPVQE